MPYFRRDLARVHHRGFAFHAEATAPGVIELLRPVRERAGTVLEIGCGTGLLTRALIDAGHTVIATDGSPAMLELARDLVPEADLRLVVLPDDPLPEADAVVGVGHTLNYLPDAAAIDRGLIAVAEALRPGGLIALDLCDLAYGAARADAPPVARVEDDWAIVTRLSRPSPDRFVRDITTFTREDSGAWRRDDELHDNVLIDTSAVPGLLREHGVEAEVRPAFGSERLPDGLVAVIGRAGAA